MPKEVTNKKLYLSEDANGSIFVSKKRMNINNYLVVAKLKAIETKRKKPTQKGVFIGAICLTIDDELLKILEIKMVNGIERSYIK